MISWKDLRGGIDVNSYLSAAFALKLGNLSEHHRPSLEGLHNVYVGHPSMLSLSLEEWTTLFRFVGYRQDGTPATPPDSIRLYRGAPPDRIAGLSWSPDPRIAESYAFGKRRNHGSIYTCVFTGPELLAEVTTVYPAAIHSEVVVDIHAARRALQHGRITPVRVELGEVNGRAEAVHVQPTDTPQTARISRNSAETETTTHPRGQEHQP